MRSILLTSILALACLSVNAQCREEHLNSQPCVVITKPQEQTARPEKPFFSPFGKGFKVSMSTLVSATIYDAVRSKQKISTGMFKENNPFLRNKQGGLSMPKYVAFNSIFIGATILLERKHPKLAAFIRVFASGGHIVAAEMK